MKINKRHCLLLLLLSIIFILSIGMTSAAENNNDTTTIEESNDMPVQDFVQEEVKDLSKHTNEDTKTASNYIYVNSKGSSASSGTTKTSPTTLENAISSAQDNQIIILTTNSSTDTYKFTNSIYISYYRNSNNITILGESGKNIIFDGQNITGLFDVQTVTLKLENINIINFNSNSGTIRAVNSNIILNNCTFINNTSPNTGSVIYAKNSQLTSTSSNYISNKATTGGVFFLQETNTVITNSKFTNNIASQLGGAITQVGNKSLKISGSTFTNNNAVYDGGSIYTIQSNVEITTSQFKNNKARNGGAVYLGNNVNNIHFTITKTLFSNNQATDSGDAVWTNYDSTITDNAFISTRKNNWVYLEKNYNNNIDNNWWSTNSPDFNIITNNILPNTWRLMTVTNTTKSNTNTITVSLNKLSDQTTTTQTIPSRTVKFTADSGTFNKTSMSITSTVTNTYTGNSKNIKVTIDNQQLTLNTKIEPYLSINNITSYNSEKISFIISSNKGINDRVTLKLNNVTLTATLNNGKQTIYYTIPSTWKANNYTTTLTYNGNTFYNSKTIYAYLYIKDKSRDISISPVNSTDLQVLKSNLPSAYDLRNESLVTSVKVQSGSGSCWVFTPMASLESVLLRKTGVSYDLSENNMKNLLKKYSTIGDSSSDPNTGNNDFQPISYLVGWYGPVNETNDKYESYSVISPILNSSLHVQDVYIMSERQSETDNDLIKQAIYNYGAVSTGVRISSTNSYTTGETINHGVTIVGWDDNFSRYNFGKTPPGDGAFIIKNSWGTHTGDNGYYYVSYYDTTIGSLCEKDNPDNENLNYVVLMENNDNYTNIYQYDTIVQSLQTTSNKVGYKNVYTAVKDENIASIGSYFLQKSNYEVEIEVNGKLVYTQTGTVTLPGYRTIKLNKYVQVNKDDQFTVTLKINRTNNGHQYIIVQYSDLYHSPIKNNQSFLAYDDFNEWLDLYDWECVAPLKVYTKDTPTITSMATYSDKQIIVTTTINNIQSKGTLTYYINGQKQSITKTVTNNGEITTRFSSNTANIPVKVVFTSENYQIKENLTVSTHELTKTSITINTNKTVTNHENITINGKLTGNQAISNKLINIKVNTKTFNTTTDQNGNYQLQVTLQAGKNTITATYEGNAEYTPSTIQTTVTLNKTGTQITLGSTKNVYVGGNVNIYGKLLADAKDFAYQNVVITVDGKSYTVTTSKYGNYNLSVVAGSSGHYMITASYAGNNMYTSCTNSTYYDASKKSTQVTLGSTKSLYVGGTVNIYGKLLVNGNDFAYQKVVITVVGNDYTVTTSKYGNYNLSVVAGSSGHYMITAGYAGNDMYMSCSNSTYFNASKKSTQITLGSTKNVYVGGKINVYGKLLVNAKDFAYQNVVITVDGKDYSVTTSKYGNYNLSVVAGSSGHHVITAGYAGNNMYTSCNNSTYYVASKKSTQITLGSTKEVFVEGKVNIYGKLLVNAKDFAYQNVLINVDGKSYSVTTSKYGNYNLSVVAGSSGRHVITAGYAGNDMYMKCSNSTYFDASKKSTQVTLGSTKNVYVGGTVNIYGKLLANGKDFANQKVFINVDGKIYNVTTSNYGNYNLGVIAGSMGIKTIKATYYESNMAFGSVNTTYYNASKKSTQVTLGSTKNVKAGNNVNVYGKLLANGKNLANQKVVITVDGKKFNVTTSNYGNFNLNIVAGGSGHHVITASYAGSEMYTSCSNSTYYDASKKSTQVTLGSTKSVNVGGTVNIYGKLLADAKDLAYQNVVITVAGNKYNITTSKYGNYNLNIVTGSRGHFVISAVYQGSDMCTSCSNSTYFDVK